MGKIINYLKVGQKVEFFSDFRNSSEKLGEGILLEKKEGDHQVFVISDQPINSQEVFSHETWEVLVESLTPLGESFHYKEGDTVSRPIKVLHSKGINKSGSFNREDRVVSPRLRDVFLSVPGIGEIY